MAERGSPNGAGVDVQPEFFDDNNDDDLFGFDTDPDMEMPILYSAEYGNLETTKALIEYGADVHERDMFGRSTLDLAAESGDVHLCKFLVSQGAHNNWLDLGLYAHYLWFLFHNNKLESFPFFILTKI